MTHPYQVLIYVIPCNTYYVIYINLGARLFISDSTPTQTYIFSLSNKFPVYSSCLHKDSIIQVVTDASALFKTEIFFKVEIWDRAIMFTNDWEK